MSEVKDTAHLDWRTLMSAGDDAPQDMIEALNEYFAPFAQPLRRDGDPKKEMLCVECGEVFTGLLSVFMGGGFEWGIAHGEGHCARCSWPARGHHYIKYPDGRDLATIRDFPLQYHPDFVERLAERSKSGG